MSPMTKLLEGLKATGKVAFVPYLTAGDPHLDATEKLVEALSAAGAAIIELGVPFSDPLADGPVNQRAAARALKSGTTLPKVIERVKRLRDRGIQTPIVLFTYFNPVFMMGVEKFARAAAKAGVNGVLCVDLPPEEAVEYRRTLGSCGLDTIFLAAPTTDASRLKVIDEVSSGFVYYVSRTGVTGIQAQLSGTLETELKEVRRHLKKPFVVGFGIAEPEQAQAVAKWADGVVVGSAIVRMIEESSSEADAVEKVSKFSRSIVSAINGR